MTPVGTTERLILRPVQESDKLTLFRLANDQRIQRGVTLGDSRSSPKALGNWLSQQLEKAYIAVVVEIKPEFLHLRRTDQEDTIEPGETDDARIARQSVVGFCRLDQIGPQKTETELGITLAAAWQVHGLGTEVLRWLMEYNFDTLGLYRMGMQVYGDNERALELYRNMGFVEECRLGEPFLHDGHWVSVLLMSMLKREWQAKKNSIAQLDFSNFDDVIVETVMRGK